MTPQEAFDPTSITGPVGPEGMTREQHALLAEHMLRNYRSAIQSNPTVDGQNISETVRGPILTEHFGLPPARTTGDPERIAVEETMTRVLHAWVLGAHTVLLTPDNATHFVDWLKDNKITHYAGANVDEKFLTANTLYGIDFSQAPISLVPTNEPDKPPRITVSSVSFLVTCHGILAPFPTNALEVYDDEMQTLIKSPYFRRSANVIAWIVEGGTNKVYLYAGTMEYGRGGALMQPVSSLADLSNALNGVTLNPAITRMTRLGQFVCSMVTSLVRFVGPEYDALAADARPAETEVTYD